MFRENTRTLSFRYAHVDIGSDIVIKFNPKHKAEYSVIIYYENKLREIYSYEKYIYSIRLSYDRRRM